MQTSFEGVRTHPVTSSTALSVRVHPVTFCCDFVSGNRIVHVARPLVVS